MHLRCKFEQGQVGSLGPADHMCDPETLCAGGRVEMKKPHLHGVLREVRNAEERARNTIYKHICQVQKLYDN